MSLHDHVYGPVYEKGLGQQVKSHLGKTDVILLEKLFCGRIAPHSSLRLQAALLDEAEKVREELEGMKKEKRRHDEAAEQLHAEFIEASKKAAQAMSLEGELGALSVAYEHQLEDMSVLERMKNMLESSQKATKALYAEQRQKLDEVERAKKAVEVELVAAMERLKELNWIRGMTAQEVCESWPFDAEGGCKKSEVNSNPEVVACCSPPPTPTPTPTRARRKPSTPRPSTLKTLNPEP
jgi:flagellar biosynthesis GTPase FlhF